MGIKIILMICKRKPIYPDIETTVYAVIRN